MIKNILLLLCPLCLFAACSSVPREVVRKIDFQDVKWYADRASAAYDTPQQIRTAFPNTRRIVSVRSTDIQYFLEQDKQRNLQIVSVRGTNNLKNAAEDADYIPSRNPYLDIYVHSGFDKVAMKIYKDLRPHLSKDHEVRLTGHSLGAAVSTLLMMYLHEEGFTVGPSINFGQPKVTNHAGVERYKDLPLLRVVDENDVVPLVPPVTLLDSLHGIYEHLGKEVILLEGEYYVFLDRHEAEKLSEGDFWKALDDISVKQHFMANYIRNINSKLEKSVQVQYQQRENFIASN